MTGCHCGQGTVFLGAFARLRKKRLLASSCLSFRLFVRPSFRMEQLGSRWTDFYEILYLSIFRKSVEKFYVLLKFGKNNGYFTWRPKHIYDYNSLNSSLNEKCWRQNLYRKSKHTFYVQKLFFFRKSCCLCDNVEK